ncbi:MAG: LysM peptidoglycan-binding domain-containing protein, partial [Pirellulales bacterium]
DAPESGVTESVAHEFATPRVSFMPKPVVAPPLADGDDYRQEGEVAEDATDVKSEATTPESVRPEVPRAEEMLPAAEESPSDFERPVELPRQRLVAPTTVRPKARVAPASSAAPQESPTDREKYTVCAGDTLWSIAQRTYGSGGFFRALAQFNRQRIAHADELKAGTEILLPDEQELRRRFPQLCPNVKKKTTYVAADATDDEGAAETPPAGSRVYVVEEGDTLIEIARYELGDAARWQEIARANQRVLRGDANEIAPGMKLVLPAKSTERTGARAGSLGSAEARLDKSAVAPSNMKQLKR